MTNTNNEGTSIYDWRKATWAEADRLKANAIDKPFALTPIMGANGIGVGAAYQDEAGYNATTYGPFETWDNAKQFCEHINAKLGMTLEEADAIIASSMRAQNEARLMARAPQLLAIVEFLGEWLEAGSNVVHLDALFGEEDDYTLADAVRDALQD